MTYDDDTETVDLLGTVGPFSVALDAASERMAAIDAYQRRQDAAAAQLAAQIIREDVTLAELPPGAPRDRLAALLTDGRRVHLYRTPGQRLVIEVGPVPMGHDPRWSAPAWGAYVRGEHLTALETPCMCAPCQDARQAAARARYSGGA